MYVKVRFEGTRETGATAGLVLEHAKCAKMSVGEISRLFPMREAPKMRTLQVSPAYTTWDAAFAHVFSAT
jgi:hypothetical protein